MKNSLLPTWDKITGIISGTYIENLEFCSKNSQYGKCFEHYSQMQIARPGFYTCPYGLTTLIFEQNDLRIIFTGFREKNTYRKNKAQSAYALPSKIKYNPVLPSAQILRLAEASVRNNLTQIESTALVNLADDTMHEIRTLNAAIKSKCDIIWNTLAQNDSMESDKVLNSIIQYIRNIHSSAYIIQSRFMLYDYLRNPDGQAFGETFTGGVYKKFDKLRMILTGYGKKSVKYEFVGSSRLCYPLHSSFEILVFLLLENAIKYSPDPGEIYVQFIEVINAHANKLTVIIESEGPFCTPEELSTIFLRGIRGKNAKQLKTAGSGIGLYLSKTLADLHKISLKADSIRSRELDGVVYGRFSMTMVFDETLLSEPDSKI